MTVLFRIGADGNGTVYYNVDSKKLKALKSEYKRGGWHLKDLGEQGRTFMIRVIELS